MSAAGFGTTQLGTTWALKRRYRGSLAPFVKTPFAGDKDTTETTMWSWWLFEPAGPSPQSVIGTAFTNATAFGAASLLVDRRIDGAAFVNAQSWGTARIDLVVPVSGFTNSQSWGATVVTAAAGLSVTPGGWVNGQTFGATRIDLSILASSLANAQAFGTALVRLDQWIQPSALVNAPAFGATQLHRTIAAVGFVNAQAYGAVEVRVDRQVLASGFTVTHNFGTATVSGGAPPDPFGLPYQVRVVQARISVR